MSQLPTSHAQRAAAGGRDPNRGQVRATFHPPPDFDEAASVWVRLAEGRGGATVTLLYDYPDFRPQAGWRIKAGGKTYEIKAAGGRNLDCVEGGGE